MNTGWIKLHRKILDNPIVCKDPDYFTIWIYLLLNATHTEYDVIFKGKRRILKSGELLSGRKSISEKTKISESKVQRILKTFQNEQQIEQQTTNINRLISITKWDCYQITEQQHEQQLNNEGTTTEQRVNTNNNVNNIKKEKNVKFIKPTIDQIKEYCTERNNNINAERFFDHYEANGWMTGKNKLKDWKAAVRTWEKNQFKPAKKEGAYDTDF
jgi:hypothetical protein